MSEMFKSAKSKLSNISQYFDDKFNVLQDTLINEVLANRSLIESVEKDIEQLKGEFAAQNEKVSLLQNEQNIIIKKLESIINTTKKTHDKVANQDYENQKADREMMLKVVTDNNKKSNEIIKEIQKQQCVKMDALIDASNSIKDLYNANCIEITEKLKHIDSQTRANYSVANEVVWSQVFHDSIIDSKWLKNKTFSPGRWAIGYPFLYVMYKVLNEFAPNHILEMGLGESTKMTMQYSQSRNIATHIVTEHDKQWCEFFKINNVIPDNVQIMMLDLETSTYKKDTQVLSYAKFEETFRGKKFDFICIDAPFGGKAVEYARVDVCRLLPDILSDKFVIMIDDSQRKGEQNTIKEIELILTKNKVRFKSGKYKGIKELYIITSKDLTFLCTQ